MRFFFLFYQHTRYDLISTSKYSMKFNFLGFWKQSTSHCNPILGALGNNLNIHSLIKYSWGSKKQFSIKIWKTTVFTFKSLFGSTEKFYFSPSDRFSQILSHAWVNEIIDNTIIKKFIQILYPYSNELLFPKVLFEVFIFSFFSRTQIVKSTVGKKILCGQETKLL